MKKIGIGLIALIFTLSLATSLSTAQAAETIVSGVKFSWSNQVYAPQSATENEYLVVNYENTSSKDFWSVGFSTEEPSGKKFLFFGAVPGVKTGEKGAIRVSLNYLAFLNVRGPIDYKINLCTRVALTDPEVCSKSTLTFITDKPITTASPSPASVKTCAAGGDCKVGDIGPGGGIIVYVSPSIQTWGRYIEAAPKGWYLGRLDPQKKPFCPDRTNSGTDFVNTKSQIGSGLSNSIAIKRLCPYGGAVADAMAYQGNGLSDWFLPSMDELNELYYSRAKIGLEESWYWSSTTSQYYQITSLFVPSGILEGNSSATNDHKIRPVRYGYTKADLEAKANAEAKAKAAAIAAANKKTTITCVKGKLTKKVTAVKPKCPSGYKVKK